MRKSRFTQAQIVAILGERETGVPVAQVCRTHGVSLATYYQWKSKYAVSNGMPPPVDGIEVPKWMCQTMRLAESDRHLAGRVEVDDAYFGGERSGGKAGRGSENKVPFVAAVQTTEDGRPHLACLSMRPFTKAAL